MAVGFPPLEVLFQCKKKKCPQTSVPQTVTVLKSLSSSALDTHSDLLGAWGSIYLQTSPVLCCTMLNLSVVSDSSQARGLWPTRLLCPRGFSRQEHWSGLPCPAPEDLSTPGIEPRSPAVQAASLPSEPPGKPCFSFLQSQISILKLPPPI